MRCDAMRCDSSAWVNNERRIQALVSGRRMDEAGRALRNGLATPKRYAMQVTGTAALQSEAPPAIPPLLIAT